MGIALFESESCIEIVKLMGYLLLKLESVYHVPAKCVDDLVEQLQFIHTISVLSIPKLIYDVFDKNACAVDDDVVDELVDKLQNGNLLSAAFSPDVHFSSRFKSAKYFKENFNVIEPVEYILDPVANRSSQYIPAVHTLQNLFNNPDIVQSILTKQSDSKHLASSHDGKFYKGNELLCSEEPTLSLILYIDDFEVCNSLGTSRKKKLKVTAVYWVLEDVPPEQRSQLTSIYLALLCKAVDVKQFGYVNILEPLLKDLTVLEKEGIYLSCVGKNISGTVFCVTADNLGAHSLCGLVESFSGYYICRFCMGDLSCRVNV